MKDWVIKKGFGINHFYFMATNEAKLKCCNQIPNLVNPDFAALARAYGLHGELVQKTDDFSQAFQRCQESGSPGLIEIQIHQDQISPRATITGLRQSLKN